MLDHYSDKKKKVFVLRKVDSISPPKAIEQTINIFSPEQLHFLKGINLNSISQRKIVGKLDSFLKSKEMIEDVTKQQQFQIIKQLPKKISFRRQSQQSMQSYSSHAPEEKKSKRIRNYDVVTQKQAMEHFKQIEQRIKLNKDIENEYDKNSKIDKSQINALNRFQYYQQKWDSIIEQTSRKAGKQENDSMIQNQILFRQKQEQLEFFEMTKNQELSKPQDWHMKLRDKYNYSGTQQQDEYNSTKIYQDPFNWNTYYVDKSHKPIEIVRNVSQSNSVSKSSLRKNQSHSSLNLLKLHLQYDTFKQAGDDISSLQVEGVNVLQKEKDFVKYALPSERFQLYKTDKEQNGEEL